MTSPNLTPAPQWTGSSAVRSMLWIAVDRWGTRLMSLLTLVVFARLLAPSDFGVISLAMLFVGLINVFVDYGFSSALIQRRELRAEHLDSAFWTALGMSLVLFAAMFLCAPWLAALMKLPELAPILRCMCGAVVINAMSSTPVALLERSLEFKRLAARRMSSTLVGGGVGIAAALSGAGVWSLVVQTLATSIISFIALWMASAWRPRWRFDRQALRELVPVGVSVVGIEMASVLNVQADRLLIGLFLTTEALGYYFIGVRSLQIMSELLSSVFSGAALPAFSRIQDDRELLLKWLYRLTGTSSVVALPVFMLAALLAPVLMPVVLGSHWQPSVVIFQVLCLLGALTSVTYFDRSALLAVGKARSALFLVVGQCVLGVVLLLFAVRYGILAVAIAIVTRQYLFWPVRIMLLKRAVGIRPRTYLAQWLRPFAACVVVFSVIGAATWQWPVLTNSAVLYVSGVILVALAGYAGALRWLHPDAFDDVRSAIAMLRRPAVTGRE